MKYIQGQYSYEDFIKEKEARGTVNLPQSEESEVEIDDDLDLAPSDDDNKISKLDLDKAYEMYLSKKQEILKSYQLAQEENNENNNII